MISGLKEFGITYKKVEFIIHPEYFDSNNIFSHTFIQNLRHKPNMVQDLSIKVKIELKNIYIGEQCKTANTPNTTHHWQ